MAALFRHQDELCEGWPALLWSSSHCRAGGRWAPPLPPTRRVTVHLVRAGPPFPLGVWCRPFGASLPSVGGNGTLAGYLLPVSTPLTTHVTVWRAFLPGTLGAAGRAQASRTNGDAPPPDPQHLNISSSVPFLSLYLSRGEGWVVFMLVSVHVCVGGASLPAMQEM